MRNRTLDDPDLADRLIAEIAIDAFDELGLEMDELCCKAAAGDFEVKRAAAAVSLGIADSFGLGDFGKRLANDPWPFQGDGAIGHAAFAEYGAGHFIQRRAECPKASTFAISLIAGHHGLFKSVWHLGFVCYQESYGKVVRCWRQLNTHKLSNKLL